jgi:hypothetical protein
VAQGPYWVDGFRIAGNHRHTCSLRRCQSEYLPHCLVADWLRQWLQLKPRSGPLCLLKLQTYSYNSIGLVKFVSISLCHGKNCVLKAYSITDFNVVISVFSVFMLLLKVVLFMMHIWIPLLSVIVNLIIVVLWVVSIYGQAGPDYSDPAYPSSVAWYIAKSCSYASPSGNYGNCQQAKGAFAASVLMLLVS